MKSSRDEEYENDRPFVRGRFDRLRLSLLRSPAPASAATPEAWEDEDFLDGDADEELDWDPWRDDSPELESVSQQIDKPQMSETRLPNDASAGWSTPISDDTAAPSGPGDNTRPRSDIASALPLPLDPDISKQSEAWKGDGAFEEQASAEESENPPISGDVDGTGDFDFDPEDFEEAFPHFDDPDAEAWAEHFDDALDFEAELFDYDAEARQRVWDDEPEDIADSSLRARQKAAEIVSLLPFTSQRERDALLPWLTGLFQHRDKPATYRAILAVAERGVSSEILRNMAALRDIWESRPEWWLGRYGWARSIAPLSNGATALTWKLARSICEARSDFPPEYMIDDAWMHEWLCLTSYDGGYWSFPQFIGMKMAVIDETFQDTTSWSDFRQRERDEFGDRRNQVNDTFRDTGATQ